MSVSSRARSELIACRAILGHTEIQRTPATQLPLILVPVQTLELIKPSRKECSETEKVDLAGLYARCCPEVASILPWLA